MVFRKFQRKSNLLSHSAEVMRVDRERINTKGQIVIKPESSFSESGMTKFKSPYLSGHPAKKRLGLGQTRGGGGGGSRYGR